MKIALGVKQAVDMFWYLPVTLLARNICQIEMLEKQNAKKIQNFDKIWDFSIVFFF